DKDSDGNKPPADMKPIHPTVADPSGTDVEYQMDETQSTRLRDDIEEETQVDEEEHQSSSSNKDKPVPSHTPVTQESGLTPQALASMNLTTPFYSLKGS
nr:hypothetical protein [Tanacetum cinerariifolium]